MNSGIVRAAYSNWPRYNRQLRDAVSGLTVSQLGIRPAADRWPIWASVGHTACQRVSWLCGFAGESGAAATPFPDALYRCPGDEYLEPAMTGLQLAEALDSTFMIVEHVLDTWTLDMLGEEIRRTWQEEMAYTRGSIIQRVFGHDIWHAAELNETLAANGLPQIDFWD